MSSRASPPFRADHVGSLLRPARLLEARRRRADDGLSIEDLAAIEDEAIAEVVAMQEDVGLQSATDGELRRASWHMDFIYELGGISASDEHIDVHFKNADGTIEFSPPALKVSGRLVLQGTIFGDAFSYLASKVTTAVPKLTIPSPSMVHYRGGKAMIDPSVYPDVEEFWTDLSAVYAEEIRRLGALGCRYLQLDDTSLAYLNDPAQRAMVGEFSSDSDAQHLRYIRQINAALDGRPATMAVTVHTCRGNFQSHWVAEGGYDFVAEALFSELEVDGFFLEYDDERSGDFRALRFVPPGKMVVLGLVTTKRGTLEDKDALKARIDEAAKFVPLDQLCLSPQCGFSSTAEGNRLSVEEEMAKLRLVVETAQEVWG
ncbi:MAG: 5-methyltetrahydropteroyltriglutamate--homocysteine S-methyltransferase [Acidimicrobiales bacterium]